MRHTNHPLCPRANTSTVRPQTVRGVEDADTEGHAAKFKGVQDAADDDSTEAHTIESGRSVRGRP